MELGTFGAIISFGLALEERATSIYSTEGLDLPRELLEDLARSNRKRYKRLERARREGVAEMILESITGLDRDHYSWDGIVTQRDQVIAFEHTCARFYRHAADKLPIREISRLLEKLAQENEERAERIAAS